MAIRTVKYTVSAGGISPTSIKSGGIQGEHNATELEFSLEPSLLLKIQHQAGENTPLYRFDAYCGTGEKISTEPSELNTDIVYFLLDNQITASAADVRVYLIISVLENDKTLMDLYSFPAVISISPLPDGETVGRKEYNGITALYSGAKTAAETANTAADIAVYAAERTEKTMADLTEGAEFIFLGGNAESAIDISLAVDDEIDEFSKNPVQSAAIYEYIDKAFENLMLAAHPVGSYYFSTKPNNPAALFGGVWEQVSDKFILAAGENYLAGSTGGSEKHTHALSSNGYAKIAAIGGTHTDSIMQERIEVEEFSAVMYPLDFNNDVTQPSIWGSALGGKTDEHSNMPPYEVAYCFKRIA